MKNTSQIIAIVILLFISENLLAQGTPIPQSNYSIQSVSAQNGTNVATRAIDGNTTTFWATVVIPTLPVSIEIDLGTNFDVNGFSFQPKTTNNNNKPESYELYLSNNGTAWGTPEAAGTLTWASSADLGKREFFFGAISARYVKIVYLSGTAGNNNIQTSEILIYESATAPTGQANQIMTFNDEADQFTTSSDFALSATTTSSLPITYTVVSGPATIVGNMVSLTGVAGIVELKAAQLGDASFYPTSLSQSIEVFDLSSYNPVITTRLTDAFPVEMPSLMFYPVYMNADIAFPDSLSVDSVTFSVSGQEYLSELHTSGYYYYLWQPASYGIHAVDIKAYASNGNVTTVSKNIEVSNVISNQNVTTLNAVDITFGGVNSRNYYGTYSIPQHVGAYDNITANLTIQCPATSNACDDWDRWAYIDIKAPDGNWIQIIRYITPYGVACNHSIDLTDYASLLQGEFEFRMFIDTWGTGGWLATLDFDYNAGAPAYNYSMVDELWDGSYDLGNIANKQPVDTITYSFPINAQAAKLRASNTGHGWGSTNSQNAAEFYNATNYFHVNGVQTFTQNLWNNCNPNPDNCTGQQGTWTYSRAGWCPGAISPPNEYSLTPYIGTTIDLAYEFDPTYTDFCHPSNPSCISGITCSDCNAGSNPTYYVDGQVISYSNSLLLYNPLGTGFVDNVLEYEIGLYPNPSVDYFNLDIADFEVKTSLLIQGVDGRAIRRYSFSSNSELKDYKFDVSEIPSGTYFISVENAEGRGVQKLVIQH
jgi:hypothetical protein